MTDISPEVAAVTEACEALKIRYSQETEGMYVTFCIHPKEMPAGLATSNLRTRWMLAMVQIGDDEKPVPKPVSAEKKKRVQNHNVMMAAILCGEPTFQKFLSQRYSKQWRGALGTGRDQAADTLRNILKIDSRRDIAKEPEAFEKIHAEYEMWKAGK